MNPFSPPLPKWLCRTWAIFCILAVAGIIAGSVRTSTFWMTSDQRGDSLFHEKKFAEAARCYTDPLRIGMAQYRDGNFAAAAQTFTRVPGETGFYNQGNSWLLRGKYDLAISAYDKALALRPGWKEAEENKTLAILRKSRIEHAGDDAPEAPDQAPDQFVFDQKGENGKTDDMAEGNQAADDETRALWLRMIQTTPKDFLRAKFAFQESRAGASPTKENK